MPTQKKRTEKKSVTGPNILEGLIQQAIQVVKKAKKHRASLSGDNFYANKLADLRADATNTFRDLTATTAGDISALAEMIEDVFSPKTDPKCRIETGRELAFSLRTTWKESGSVATSDVDALFPLNILANTRRGYLVTVGRQMNRTFSSGSYDASAVMMRRLLEISLIEAFESKGIAGKIKDSNDNYVQLSALVTHALAESSWSLSRNAKKHLPNLRDLGHQSAHGRYFTAQRSDLEKLQPACRVVIEELLHIADLL